MSMKGLRTLTDSKGGQLAGYRKKMLSMHATPYMTILNQAGEKMVVATIKKPSNFQLEECADIYLHNPPMRLDNVTTNGLQPAIHVEGDILSRKYNFMMGDLHTNPYKIAQVVDRTHLYHNTSTNTCNTYFVEIGRNVDIAFITLCAYAIDEMFNEAEAQS